MDGLKELDDVREAIQNDPHPDSADPSGRHTGPLSVTGAPAADTKGQISWAMFQWARDPVRGQAIWGNINSVAGFFIACFGPILGAIADTGGRRKPWLIGFVSVMVPAIFMLWWALPQGAGLGIFQIAALFIIVPVSFSFTEVFHNSMLPVVAPQERVGFLSGLAMAMSNAGALLILCFMLYAFMLPGHVSWGFIPDHALFGLDVTAHENSRISAPITAIWLFIFTLPELMYLLVVIIVAICITAAYANSRTMLARIAPPSKMSEFFGLYALSGTATAFMGPLLVGQVTWFFASQRAGFALMYFVDETRVEAAD